MQRDVASAEHHTILPGISLKLRRLMIINAVICYSLELRRCESQPLVPFPCPLRPRKDWNVTLSVFFDPKKKKKKKKRKRTGNSNLPVRNLFPGGLADLCLSPYIGILAVIAWKVRIQSLTQVLSYLNPFDIMNTCPITTILDNIISKIIVVYAEFF